MKDIDNILKSLRTEIPDNGFSERVIKSLPRHMGLSRNFYRIPTLTAALVTLLILITLTINGFSYGELFGKAADKYSDVATSLLSKQKQPAEYDPFDF